MTFFRSYGTAAAVTVLLATAAQPVAAQQSSSSSSSQYVSQHEIINGVVQNIIQNVRDELYRRKLVPVTSGRSAFSGEDSQFDSRDPFAAHGMSDPFDALAYAKAPYLKAPPAPVSTWLYGANLVGSGDGSTAAGVGTSVATVTGAFDVTKIGVFTATDALTFIGTGSGSWAHTSATSLDATTPAGSGTLSYLNGGFSADFTSLASWTRDQFLVGPALEGSTVSYTGNVQYRGDLPHSIFLEPTLGVTYTEGYTADFGVKVSDMTEIHGGLRAGGEFKWMGYTVEPVVSAQMYQIVDSSGVGLVAPLLPSDVLGFRGSGKVTVIWNPHLSSYLEVHGSTMSTSTAGFATIDVVGGQAGLRYTWN